ncbi:MAG: tetratricopeptide repeat protein [Promethearchaeota archaeon]
MFNFLKKKNNMSKVRAWAEAQEKRYRNGLEKERPIKVLSDSIIHGLSKFCEPKAYDKMYDKMPDKKRKDPIYRLAKKIHLEHSNDASLFEIGCYLYFRIDLWHLQNKKGEYRETVVKYFIDRFLSVFKDVSNLKNIEEILQNRWNLYGRLVRECKSREELQKEIDFYLPELVVRTANNTQPKIYNFIEDFPVTLLDSVKKWILEMEIHSFDRVMIPTCLENIEKYYEIIKIISEETIGKGPFVNDELEDKVSNLVAEDKNFEAIRKIDEILNLDDDNIGAYLLKARVLQFTKGLDEAIKLYQYIIEKYPKNIDIYKKAYIDAYTDLIEIYDISSKRYRDDNKIIELCKDLKTIDERKTPYYLLAKAYANLGNYELSIESYDKAIKQEKLNLEAYSIILKSSKYQKGVKEIIAEEKINSINKLYEAYCGKANVLKSIVKYKEAISNYKEAINLNIEKNCEHESYFEYESIADIYSLLGDTEKASYYLKKAKEFEKISNDLYDKEKGYMTEDEFNKWYDENVELDDKGNIINIKSNKKDKNKR